jgi:hypothetical protein
VAWIALDTPFNVPIIEPVTCHYAVRAGNEIELRRIN